jgi:predicted acetyltransferase
VPVLIRPSSAVRESFLAGTRAMGEEEGTPTAWLDEAAADFDALVAGRSQTRQLWDVPVTELWYVDGPYYIGTVMIRHELTPQLRRDGGHIGYHVVPGQRRRGHATAMLAAACAWCRDIGLSRVLVTCTTDNAASQRVIEANAGVLEGEADGVLRYWIDLSGVTPYLASARSAPAERAAGRTRRHRWHHRCAARGTGSP